MLSQPIRREHTRGVRCSVGVCTTPSTIALPYLITQRPALHTARWPSQGWPPHTNVQTIGGNAPTRSARHEQPHSSRRMQSASAVQAGVACALARIAGSHPVVHRREKKRRGRRARMKSSGRGLIQTRESAARFKKKVESDALPFGERVRRDAGRSRQHAQLCFTQSTFREVAAPTHGRSTQGYAAGGKGRPSWHGVPHLVAASLFRAASRRLPAGTSTARCAPPARSRARTEAH